jgi:hypothetical protein
MNNRTPKGFSMFLIIDNETGQTLAKLPTTVPISDTVDSFERAGYSVRWRFANAD